MTFQTYMKTPLVVWAQTFSVETISYNDLIDGYFLNEVFQQIDRKCGPEGIIGKIETSSDRIHNWEVLVKNIRSYYQEVLQQYIIMKPPDICIICYQFDTDFAREQLDIALMLLLGCAVQCEEKDLHVETIKGMEVDVQHAIMEYIKEVTDFGKSVLNVNIPLKEIDDSSLTLYTHLGSLINQRDAYVQEIKNLHQTLNSITSSSSSSSLNDVTGIDGHWSLRGQGQRKRGHLSYYGNRLSMVNMEMTSAVGQAEYRAVLRKLKQEILDKNDALVDMEDEVGALKKEVQKLKNENYEVTQQARMGKVYMDELDVYKEKASQWEKLERDLKKSEERLKEMDYLKDRVDELRSDNCLLMDAKRMLEDRMEAYEVKVQLAYDMELDLIKYKKKLDESLVAQDEYRERMRSLQEKLESLEREREVSKRMSFIEDSLTSPDEFQFPGMMGSLADQLLQASQSQILILETKLQKMQNEVSNNRRYISQDILKALDINADDISLKCVIRKTGKSGDDGDDAIGGEEEDDDDGNRTIHGDDDDDEVDKTFEKEVLFRINSLKDESSHLKSKIENFNKIIESSKEKFKEIENSNVKQQNENKSSRKTIENLEKKLATISGEKGTVDSENIEIRKKLESANEHIKVLELKISDALSGMEYLKGEKEEMEKEMRRLKQSMKEKSLVLEEYEANVGDLNLEIAEMRKQLESMNDLEMKIGDFEVQIQELNKAAVVDKQMISQLREELLNEKLKTQSVSDELMNASKKCEAYQTGQLISPKHRLAEKLHEEKLMELESSRKRILELEQCLDDHKMQVAHLQSELNTSHKLQLNATKDRTMMVTQRYSHSPSATQEILNLKDTIIKLERSRDTLQQENDHHKQQIENLKQTILEQSSSPPPSPQSISSQSNNQSKISALQLEKASIEAQNSALSAQIAQLKLSLIEAESKVELLTNERISLEDNCRALQKLHDKLGVEHECLQDEHSTLKGVQRIIKTDLKTAMERINNQEKIIEELRKALYSTMTPERPSPPLPHSPLSTTPTNSPNTKTLYNITNNNNTTMTAPSSKEETLKQNQLLERLQSDNQLLSTDLRNCRSEIDQLKELAHHYQDQLTHYLHDNAQYKMEIARLIRIEHLYTRIEEENQILSDQLKRTRRSSVDSVVGGIGLGGSGGGVCGGGLVGGGFVGGDVVNRKNYQKILIERLSENANKQGKVTSSLSENTVEKVKKKLKNGPNTLIKKTQNILERKPSDQQMERKDLYGKSKKKSQEDFISIETTPTVTKQSSDLVHTNELMTKFVDWSKKNVLMRNKKKDSGQQTSRSPSLKLDANDDDDEDGEETITLNQFLSECNQSPKSRRKLLLQKRVTLDDEVFCNKDFAPLNPRSPILFDRLLTNNNNNNNNNINDNNKNKHRKPNSESSCTCSCNQQAQYNNNKNNNFPTTNNNSKYNTINTTPSNNNNKCNICKNNNNNNNENLLRSSKYYSNKNKTLPVLPTSTPVRRLSPGTDQQLVCRGSWYLQDTPMNNNNINNNNINNNNVNNNINNNIDNNDNSYIDSVTGVRMRKKKSNNPVKVENNFKNVNETSCEMNTIQSVDSCANCQKSTKDCCHLNFYMQRQPQQQQLQQHLISTSTNSNNALRTSELLQSCNSHRKNKKLLPQHQQLTEHSQQQIPSLYTTESLEVQTSFQSDDQSTSFDNDIVSNFNKKLNDDKNNVENIGCFGNTPLKNKKQISNTSISQQQQVQQERRSPTSPSSSSSNQTHETSKPRKTIKSQDIIEQDATNNPNGVGTVRNLINSYQRSFNSPTSPSGNDDMDGTRLKTHHLRPMSAGVNQEKTTQQPFHCKIDRVSKNSKVDQEYPPRVCMVRPATASVFRSPSHLGGDVEINFKKQQPQQQPQQLPQQQISQHQQQQLPQQKQQLQQTSQEQQSSRYNNTDSAKKSSELLDLQKKFGTSSTRSKPFFEYSCL